MKITIDVFHNQATATLQIQTANEAESCNPLPLLERAIEELRWQISSYGQCSYHA